MPSEPIAPPTFASRNDREMRRAGTGLAVIVVLFWSVFVARFVLHGPVTPERLAWSVAGETGSAAWVLDTEPHCERAADRRRWRCTVMDSGGSGGVDYAITMRGESSCWRGRLVSETGEVMPERADGCLSLLSLIALR